MHTSAAAKRSHQQSTTIGMQYNKDCNAINNCWPTSKDRIKDTTQHVEQNTWLIKRAITTGMLKNLLHHLKSHHSRNSWVSRDVIISLGVNSKSMHRHRKEIVSHRMCWSCVCQQICAISWDFFTPVQHNHQYILGWPPLRLTAKYPSETQE